MIRYHAAWILPISLASFAVAVGLVAYDSWFLKKTRTLR